jgi:hypothetical protein
MSTLEEMQVQADAEVDAAKPLYIRRNNEQIERTDEEYAQLKKDIADDKWNKQQYGYIEARQRQYKPITEQLDMQYWDSVNDTTTWADHIAKVKSDNPKPE